MSEQTVNSPSTAQILLQEVSKCYGITPPVSLALPEEGDLAQTTKMVEQLKSYGLLEDNQELKHREKVLEKLQSLFREWLTEVCEEKDVPEIVKAKVGGRVLPFGSFHLGAHTKGGDIDALCVGPGFVERKAFFTSFYEKLKAQKEVKDLQALEEAWVPLIKLTFDGIEVDLVYACMNRRSIHDKLDLLDNELLRGMDAASVRSLNGYKVTEEILRNVPDVKNFQLALRAIKLWAKRRSIYSCKHGFLGGVSWAILVARVCQIYPNASAATLVNKFFKAFDIWQSPYPVMLKKVINPGLNIPEWDPRVNPGDRAHLMPIITPAYPQQNSSFGVSRSTLTIIKEEIKRGFEVTEAILQEKDNWSTLFETSQFTDQYKHYIRLNLTSAPENHSEWVGLLESKIRHLVGTIERNWLISLAHINIKPHVHPRTDGLKTTLWLIGLVFNMDMYKYTMVNFNNELKSFQAHVHSLAEALKMSENNVTISAKYIVREGEHWVIPNEYKRVFKGPNPNVHRKATAPFSTGQQAMNRTGWPQPPPPAKSQQASQGIPRSTASQSAAPSVAQQSLKMPLAPQPGPSSKRLRAEDASSRPSPLVKQTKEMNSAAQTGKRERTPEPEPPRKKAKEMNSAAQTGKRERTPEPEPPRKKAKVDLAAPTLPPPPVSDNELADAPVNLSRPVITAKRNITLKLCRRPM